MINLKVVALLKVRTTSGLNLRRPILEEYTVHLLPTRQYNHFEGSIYTSGRALVYEISLV